jgi:hypothetical protein
MSMQTGTWTECIFTNRADYTALASFTSEASLLGGLNLQPTLYPSFFEGTRSFGRGLSIVARGVLSVTATPTYTFTVRIGTALASIGGTVVGISNAITAINGVTNKWWELRLDLVCNTPGQGSGNTTVSGSGYVVSPGGFGSPFVYPLEPSAPDTATWTATLDNSAANYVNLSATCSASSASNTIQCKQLIVLGLN